VTRGSREFFIMLFIGELSRKTGVKITTIRYYEQMGLIAKPDRSNGNQRRYEWADLERLSFIKHGRDLGLPIDDIRELVELSLRPEQSCKEAHEIAGRHLLFVKKRVAKLKRLEKELKRIVAMSDDGCVGECKIIHSLADHSLCSGEH